MGWDAERGRPGDNRTLGDRMARVILFDVNETLLDLKALSPLFERHFGDAGVASQWFARVLHSSVVATITGRYADFGQIAGAALAVTATLEGVPLSEQERSEIVDTIRRLPPHPEVPAALRMLREAGFRLATLTNSPPWVLEAQMQNGDLAQYFEELLSVHAVEAFKPSAAPYLHAAARLGVAPSDLRMVAAHDWDVFGALRAGLRGAFVARPGAIYSPLFTPPDISAPDLVAVAERIIALDGERLME